MPAASTWRRCWRSRCQRSGGFRQPLRPGGTLVIQWKRTKNAFLNGVKNLAAIFTEGLVGGDLIGGDLELGNLTRGALEGGGEVLEWGEVFCDCGESLAEGRDALRAEGRGGEGGEGREPVSEVFEAVIALGEVFKTGEMGDVFEFGEGGVRGLQEVGGDT